MALFSHYGNLLSVACDFAAGLALFCGGRDDVDDVLCGDADIAPDFPEQLALFVNHA